MEDAAGECAGLGAGGSGGRPLDGPLTCKLVAEISLSESAAGRFATSTLREGLGWAGAGLWPSACSAALGVPMEGGPVPLGGLPGSGCGALNEVLACRVLSCMLAIWRCCSALLARAARGGDRLPGSLSTTGLGLHAEPTACWGREVGEGSFSAPEINDRQAHCTL